MNQDRSIIELQPVLTGPLSLTTTQPNAGMGGQGAGGDDMPLPDFMGWLLRLRRYWWVVAGCVLLTTAAAAGYLYKAKKIYAAMATVKVAQERSAVVPVSNMPNGGAEDIKALEILKTMEQAVIGQTNLLSVINTQNLRTDPTFAVPRGYDYTDAELIVMLAKMASSEVRRGTRLIDVSVQDTDPVRAARLAQALVDEYIKSSMQEGKGASQSLATDLRAEETRLQNQYTEASAKLQAYRELYRHLPLEKDENVVTLQIQQNNAELGRLRSKRVALESTLHQLESLDGAPSLDAIMKMEGMAELQSLSTLKAGLAAKEAEFAREKEELGPKHPKYQQIQAQVVQLRKNLADEAVNAVSVLRTELSRLKDNESKIENEVKAGKDSALELNRILPAYLALKSEVDGNRVLFETVQSRRRNAELSAAAQPTPLFLQDRPVVDNKPVKPGKKIVLGIALVAGLGLGCALVMLGGLLTQSYTTVEDAERSLGLPALAVLPRIKVNSLRDGLLGEPGVEEACAEAFRSLRASLTFLGRGSQSHSILFTSPSGREGTSFTAMNYAVSLSRQGYRTLLVDGNLHRPSLDEVFFDRENEMGLASYLEGSPSAGRACRPTWISELFLLSAGRAQSNPSELLSSKKMGLLIDDARQWFHKTVLEAPSLGSNSDALLMARHADQVVLVINARSTTKKAARLAVRRLTMAGSPPVGFVFNGADDSGWLPAASRIKLPTGRAPLALPG